MLLFCLEGLDGRPAEWQKLEAEERREPVGDWLRSGDTVRGLRLTCTIDASADATVRKGYLLRQRQTKSKYIHIRVYL